jgi:hypothetical protein
MNFIFNKCVDFLMWLGPLFNLTYKEINVLIFVIIEPIIFLIMLFIIIKQYKRNIHILEYAKIR